MVIWLALIIPLVGVIILSQKYPEETKRWELGLPLVIGILLILGFKAGIEKAQTADSEFWGGWAVHAEYFEDWNERVSCRHPISCSHRDSKGHARHSNDGYHHAYDVDYHPPTWRVTDSNDITVSISQEHFERLAAKFGNRQFIALHRNYHTKNGDKYMAVWNGDDLRLEPMTTIHTYENRVKVSNSVFKFPKVDPKLCGLYEYPAITDVYLQQCILGSGDQSQGMAETYLRRWNAKLGRPKQVKMFVLLYKNQPIQAGIDQESYWQRGNKNEFVVTLGVDSENKIQWCYPFSWTDEELLKLEVRDYFMNQTQLNLERDTKWLVPEIQAKFKRKHFKDFNYLTVEPPMWSIILTFLVTGLVTFLVCLWVVKNDFREYTASNLFSSWKGSRSYHG